MNTIFETKTRAELINRINLLSDNSAAQWGKMNVYQMLKHCTLWEEMMQGKQKYPRALIGRIFGRVALKAVMKDETPLKHSTPTIPELIINEKNGDILAQKKEWISRIEEYANFSNTDFVHVFFGKMTKEQIGHMVYKHTDHHLRQFNG